MITGATRVVAVLGWPIEHSRSPQIVNAAFAAAGIDAVLVPIGVAPDDLAAVIAGLRAARFLGASVTVPHKLAVVALCDELAASAKAVGAVNCLRLDGLKLVGHNTDEGGFVDGLAAAGFDHRGRTVVILGAGGAARAVAYGVRDAKSVEVIARKPADVWWAPAFPWTIEKLRDSFSRADLVVDTTPVGLGSAEVGTEDEASFVEALPFDALSPSAWVASLVYHRRPLLLERAKARGHTTLDGRAMLVHQGARAFTVWTGKPAPIDAMMRAFDNA